MSAIRLEVEIAQAKTGMLQAVLAELLERLEAFAHSGTRQVIDIQSLPLSEPDRRDLADALGEGEVSAVLDSFGKSQIKETRYAGIWWVRHYTQDGALLSELIEITDMPDILRSQTPDIETSIQQLAQTIRDQAQENSHER
jgi:hydrogenase-1 operon protein HyaF